MVQTMIRRKNCHYIISIVAVILAVGGMRYIFIISGDYRYLNKRIPKSMENFKASDKINYAAFGTSITWGATLPDREKQSYIKLLSKDSANFGIRSTGPNYPGACTRSIIGNDQRNFDVIILEFFQGFHFGLETLTRRLRERYPDAIIIILNEWHPIYITNARTGENPKQWAERQFGTHSIYDPHLQKAFAKSRDKWLWPSERDASRAYITDKIAEQYGAHVLTAPRDKDASRWASHASHFAPDYLHHSVVGHKDIANRIRELVEKIGVPEHSRTGVWTDNDDCESWFESGKLEKGGIIAPGNSFEMVPFPGSLGKYSLQLIDGEKGSVAKVIVRNKSEKKMKLYLAYMITSPGQSKYPRMKVNIVGSSQPDVILDQVVPSSYGSAAVHILVIKQVGIANQGANRLKFTQLEDSEWPFRFGAIALTNEHLLSVAGEYVV